MPTDTMDTLTRRSNKTPKKQVKKERPLREPRTPSMRPFPQAGRPSEPTPAVRRRPRKTAPPPPQPAGSLPQQIASRRPRPWIPILLFTLLFLAMVYGCAKSMHHDDKSAPAPAVLWSAEDQGVAGLAQGAQQLF